MKKITHIPKQCVGCMACVSIAPDLFVGDDETGLAKLVEGEKEGDNFVRVVPENQALEMLEDNCLGQVIKVEEVTSPR
jgi:ferredoxin